MKVGKFYILSEDQLWDYFGDSLRLPIYELLKTIDGDNIIDPGDSIKQGYNCFYDCLGGKHKAVRELLLDEYLRKIVPTFKLTSYK